MSTSIGRGKKIGVALGGGGIRGIAHIGVLKALVAAGFEIDAIAGSSAGALVGALFASGCSPDEILELYLGVDQHRMFGRSSLDGPSLLGIYGINHLLSKRLGALTFDQLRIPFCCPAVDLKTGQEIVIHEGCVQEAVLASSAIPGVFPPRKIGQHELIDGGVLDPVPVQAVRWMAPDLPVVAVALCLLQDMPAGLDILHLPLPNSIPALIAEQISHLRIGRAFQIFVDSVDITSRTLTELRLKADSPEVIIRPEVGKFPILGKVDPMELVLLGEQAAREKISEVIQACQWTNRILRKVRKPNPAGLFLRERDQDK